MNIIHITDTHLPSAESQLVGGIDTLSRLKKLVRHLETQKADLLVVTGDISADTENIFSFKSLKLVLDTLPYPWVVLPGNHDRGDLFKNIFTDKALNTFKVIHTKEKRSLIFFDTSTEQACNKQLTLLENHLKNSTTDNYLFTHYPPVLVNHPSFDTKHVLPWRNELLDTLAKSKTPLHCFFGHIHFEYEHTRDALHFYSTPSATLPVIQGIGSDKPDERGCFYRDILIEPTGLKTSVKYVPF